MKKVSHRPAQAERGLHCFSCLSNFHIIPPQIPIALYQMRRSGVIGEEHIK